VLDGRRRLLLSRPARPHNGVVITIRPLRADDWTDVERIHREGIATGEATFEIEPPSWGAFDAGRVADARLVAVDGTGAVVGWTAASRVSTREAYRGVIEHSIYVSEAARGRGVGGVLLRAFVDAADAAGFWTIQSSIFPENAASLRLHTAAGFRVVGRRERIARAQIGPRAGQWRDTLLIERRRPD
jgi:phosphinothricin acetyltransferase